MTEEQKHEFYDKLGSHLNYLIETKHLNMVIEQKNRCPNGSFDIICLIDQENTDKILKVRIHFESLDALFSDDYYSQIDIKATIVPWEFKNDMVAVAIARVLYAVKHAYDLVQENSKTLQAVTTLRNSALIEVDRRGDFWFKEAKTLL